MKKLFLTIGIITFCLVNITYSQSKVKINEDVAAERKLDITPVHSSIFTQELSFEISKDFQPANWDVNVVNIEKKHEQFPEVQQMKEEKLHKKIQYSNFNAKEYSKKEVQPIIGENFHGNSYNYYSPPDNTMAISNAGYIVTVVNSNIEYYSENGSMIFSSSLSDFFASSTAIVYDPVVMYDSHYDRFFMVCLHGTSSSESMVYACFSKTNNPQDGWWVYSLTGNPLSDGSWFDYPKIGISQEEVYITGNLFYDSDYFNQSTLYQLDKITGYEGGSMSWQYWYNIDSSPFTLNPVSFGQSGAVGPGIYLVSNHYSSGNYINLYDLTDYMGNSPSLNVYSVSTDSYEVGADAYQNGTSTLLDVGDCRILSAFYLNGIIHFVFTSERSDGYNGINYNRLDVNGLSNISGNYGMTGYDYCYGSVASFSNSSSDHSVMICFLRSSSSTYPEVRVVNCDDNWDWSSSTSVKEGNSYVSGDATTRWGDYTGISRRHSASKEVWLAGQYGTSDNYFETWIAQVLDQEPSKVDENDINNSDITVYPNPIVSNFQIQFNIEKSSKVEITISDINGKIIKLLFKDNLTAGTNILSFNKNELTTGIYFLNIKANNKIIKNEKIVITE